MSGQAGAPLAVKVVRIDPVTEQPVRVAVHVEKVVQSCERAVVCGQTVEVTQSLTIFVEHCRQDISLSALRNRIRYG